MERCHRVTVERTSPRCHCDTLVASSILHSALPCHGFEKAQVRESVRRDRWRWHRRSSLPGDRGGARTAGAAIGRAGDLCRNGSGDRGTRRAARGLRPGGDSQRGVEGQVAAVAGARNGLAAAERARRVAGALASASSGSDWRRRVQLRASRGARVDARNSDPADGAERGTRHHESNPGEIRQCGGGDVRGKHSVLWRQGVHRRQSGEVGVLRIGSGESGTRGGS